MHIEHINISAAKELLRQERDFYCAVFDLVEGFRPAFSRAGFWLYSGQKAIIHLTESNEHPGQQRPCHLDHIAFQVSGLENLIGKLKAMNIEFTSDSLAEIGMTQIFFSDPAGIGLEANFINESLTDK